MSGRPCAVQWLIQPQCYRPQPPPSHYCPLLSPTQSKIQGDRSNFRQYSARSCTFIPPFHTHTPIPRLSYLYSYTPVPHSSISTYSHFPIPTYSHSPYPILPFPHTHILPFPQTPISQYPILSFPHTPFQTFFSAFISSVKSPGDILGDWAIGRNISKTSFLSFHFGSAFSVQ